MKRIKSDLYEAETYLHFFPPEQETFIRDNEIHFTRTLELMDDFREVRLKIRLLARSEPKKISFINKQLGTKSVGGAVLGFLVGGPVGGAIGNIIGSWITESDFNKNDEDSFYGSLDQAWEMESKIERQLELAFKKESFDFESKGQSVK